ncbi:MAG: ribonuclease E/G [Candidatus Rehaiarchaeum fermentans]|nr:ribonuclease E/G [Candidatus Rehaiarchaeum fermentans]
MKVKVKGIYSTAISKILLDAGYEIVDAGRLISAKYGTSSGQSDVEISDLPSKEGILIKGSSAKRVAESIREKLSNAIQIDKSKGRIYLSIIKGIDESNKNIIVESPDGEGIIDMRNFWGYAKPGSKILVQQKGRNSKYIILTTQIRFFGKDCVLITNGFNKMSNRIRSDEIRSKLMKVTKEANIKNKGILWKASAARKSEEDLKNEINELLKLEEKIKKEFEQYDSPRILYEGEQEIALIFDSDTKFKLDEIRKEVAETIKGHHLLKSAGYKEIVDIIENMGINSTDIFEKISKTLEQYGPSIKKKYEIILIGINGINKKITGRVEEINENVISIKNRNIYEIDKKNQIIRKKSNENEIILTHSVEIFPNFARAIYLGIAKNKEEALSILDSNKSILGNLYETIKSKIDKLWS